MKAMVMTRPGGVDVLELRDITEPTIHTPTQVKVAIQCAGINPIDTKIRSRGVFFADGLPAVLGCDGAGLVVEVGAGVTQFQPGDRVWFCHGGLGREQGNYAQYTVIEQTELAVMPQSVDFAIAAASPLVVITAWEAMFDRVRLAPEQTILIHAGAGGVGHVAIQLALQHGARVATTVSSTDKAEYVTALGVEKVIHYRDSDVNEEVMEWTDGEGAQVVFDTVGGKVLTDCFAYIAEYGHVVTLLDPQGEFDWKTMRSKNITLSLEMMLSPMLRNLPEARQHQIDILDSAARLIDDGKLQVHVEQNLPLRDATRAHTMIESGHGVGKLVLDTV
jgi:NADPH:quinone reductase